MNNATFQDLRVIVDTQGDVLMNRLHVPGAAQLSVPLDGKGLRIRVSVRPNQSHDNLKELTLRLNGREVRFRVEFSEDYQEYMAF